MHAHQLHRVRWVRWVDDDTPEQIEQQIAARDVRHLDSSPDHHEESRAAAESEVHCGEIASCDCSPHMEDNVSGELCADSSGWAEVGSSSLTTVSSIIWYSAKRDHRSMGGT